VTTSPGVGHIFPTIPTAWALRAAGHEVLIATSSNQELAARAGLPVMDTAPGVDFRSIFIGFPTKRPQTPADGQLDVVAELFAEVSAPFVDRTVALVEHWRPDLVLHSPLQAVGPLAAQIAGVPYVTHTIGLNQPRALLDALNREFAPHYEKLGVEIAAPAAILDVTPPALRTATDTIPLRYVPYNGSAVLPDWVIEPAERPRIVLTLGSVVPQLAGLSALTPLLSAAGDIDAEFVITLGGSDPAALGELPPNVRLENWVPLAPLLRTSSGIVHHGGAGTTLTALAAGLPQLIIPQGADQFHNADTVARSGAGAVVTAEDLGRAAELLADQAMRAAAVDIAAGIASQPSPAEVVEEIVALAG
jgi:UDP:flavonoid glycosyltransferase YjiC (YdhE family)